MDLKNGWLFAIVVSIIFFAAFEAGYSGWSFEKGDLGKIFGLESVLLISVTFLIGSLSKFWPKTFGWLMVYRKGLGVMGFVFAALHTFIAMDLHFSLDFGKMLASQKVIPLLIGWLAFLVFLAMTMTSTARSVKTLGYPRWKLLQRFGYVALALVLVHFFWMELRNGVFNVKPLEQAVFWIAVFAVLARIAALLAGIREKTSFQQHVTPPKA